jgi:REP element-mobilizing transposase RayT
MPKENSPEQKVPPASRPAVARTSPSALELPAENHAILQESLANIHGAIQPRYGEVHIRNRGRLPHWAKEEGLYFITFHLADSLPKSVLAKIAERHRILVAAKQTNAHLLPEQKTLLASYSHARIEEYFDRGAGACPFLDARIAGAMAAALRFRQGKHYRLLAWCIMPNHVHVVTRLFPGRELAKVVRAWKNFSAKAANHALGRKSRFWRREYYDRLIRNADELTRAIQYVAENPAKAGLKDWPWVWSAASEAHATAGQEVGNTRS